METRTSERGSSRLTGGMSALLSSARRLTRKSAKLGGGSAPQGASPSPQDEAWDMYALVGELHFLVNTLSARMAQARFVVSQVGENPGDDPEPVEDPGMQGILDAIGDGPLGLTPLIYKLGINLLVPGEGWLAGIPRELIPSALRSPQSLAAPIEVEGPDLAAAQNGNGRAQQNGFPRTPAREAIPNAPGPTLAEPGFPLDELEWKALSRSEVSGAVGGGREVTLTLGEGPDDKVVCLPEQIVLMRIWQPHPRKAWETDSPTISTLPVLRKIVGLDQRDMAQINSRLAGAGMLFAPQTAARSIRAAMGLAEDDESDPFTEALIEAMMTPIKDRSSASAVVPLVATVPDETTSMFNRLTFDNPLDAESPGMLDQSIRRMALGHSAPPELLLGTSGMNHWGAWLVQEDVVSTHLKPPLELFCSAFTEQYLWPVLIDQGMDETEAHKYVVWYDVSHLVVRPNRSTDAMELHQRGVIDDEALREETGFDESQAPFSDDELDPEVRLALDLARQAPALVGTPGLPQLAAQIRALLQGDIPDLEERQPIPSGLEGQAGQPPPPPGEQAPPGGEGEPNPPTRQQVPETQGQPPSQPPPGRAVSTASHHTDEWRVT